MTVGICGYGWVGKSMAQLFPGSNIYDSDNEEYSGSSHYTRCFESEIIFICVPTPNKADGSLDTHIVEECAKLCNDESLIVIRSTVNPGTCERINGRVVMQPEYLGETPAHPMLNPKTRPFIIIGGYPKDRKQLIDLYTKAYNANVSIRQVTAYEAEVIKLTENRAIAYKVAQCQELYDVCQKAGVDYYTIRDAVYGDDPRFNLWWTFIYTDARGFNSKCIPKDVYAWAAWAESLGFKPELTRKLLEVNDVLIGNNTVA